MATVANTAPKKETKAPKAPKATKAKSVDATPTPELLAPVPVPTPVLTPAPVAAPETVSETVSVGSDTPNSLSDLFSNLNKSFQSLNSQFSQLKSDFRQVEKQVTREMRVLDKMNARRNKNKGNRAPSGFVKPTKISDELAVFLGKESGSLMARTDVTKQITAYIRANDLQDKTNGRLILADDKLKKLLKYNEKDVTDPKQQLSYFNLQRFLSCHFEKSA
jgi:upstream activation factor subunit UAF30